MAKTLMDQLIPSEELSLILVGEPAGDATKGARAQSAFASLQLSRVFASAAAQLTYELGQAACNYTQSPEEALLLTPMNTADTTVFLIGLAGMLGSLAVQGINIGRIVGSYVNATRERKDTTVGRVYEERQP